MFSICRGGSSVDLEQVNTPADGGRSNVSNSVFVSCMRLFTWIVTYCVSKGKSRQRGSEKNE